MNFKSVSVARFLSAFHNIRKNPWIMCHVANAKRYPDPLKFTIIFTRRWIIQDLFEGWHLMVLFWFPVTIFETIEWIIFFFSPDWFMPMHYVHLNAYGTERVSFDIIEVKGRVIVGFHLIQCRLIKLAFFFLLACHTLYFVLIVLFELCEFTPNSHGNFVKGKRKIEDNFIY